MLGGIGGEFMKRKRQSLRRVRQQRDARAADLHLVGFADPVRGQFLGHQRRQVGATPARIGKERVRTRQRLDAPFDRHDVAVYAVGTRQPDDRLDHRERVAGAVIDLSRKQILALFGLFTLGDFDCGADHTNTLAVRVENPAALGRHPADNTVLLADGAILDIVQRTLLRIASRHIRVGGSLPVVGMKPAIEVRHGHRNVGRYAEHRLHARRPKQRVGDVVDVPQTDLRRVRRQPQLLLALERPRVRRLQFRRPLLYAPFQLGVEALKLTRLAIKLGEYLDLGAQHGRHDRHRHVIHRAHLVAAQPVDVVDLDGRNEDDGRALKPRMIADHGRKLKTVELRHADVDENDRGFVLQQEFERFARRRRLDEVFAEFAKDFLVGEKLRRLIVDQKNVDFFMHETRPSDGATCATTIVTARCQPAWRDSPRRPPPGISRGRPSSLSR